MKNFLNWLINSKHSETIGSIFVGVGYILFMFVAFLFYISMRGV